MQDYIKSLELKISMTYTQGVSLDDAEMLAAEFLHAMMILVPKIREKSLDARMKKSGLKAIRAGAYHDIVSKADKKPTVDALEHALTIDPSVISTQEQYDIAEVDKDELERYYDIFREAHLYFRGIAKGSMNG